MLPRAANLLIWGLIPVAALLLGSVFITSYGSDNVELIEADTPIISFSLSLISPVQASILPYLEWGNDVAVSIDQANRQHFTSFWEFIKKLYQLIRERFALLRL